MSVAKVAILRLSPALAAHVLGWRHLRFLRERKEVGHEHAGVEE